jgi:hypothetical protein
MLLPARATTPLVAVVNVIRMGSRCQMVQSNTPGVVADMPRNPTFGERAMGKLIDNAVNLLMSPLEPDRRIMTIARPVRRNLIATIGRDSVLQAARPPSNEFPMTLQPYLGK